MFVPGAIAKSAAEANAAAEVGHAGDPPPVAELIDVGAVNTTRWYAERVPPKLVAVTVLELSPVTAVPDAAVVTMKELAAGARA